MRTLMIVNYKTVALKLQSLEMTFIRLLHLLAHHPDFALTEENISDIAKCVRSLPSLIASWNANGPRRPRIIEFYLSLIGSAENVALLFHLALKAKTVRDAESHAHSEVRSPFPTFPSHPAIIHHLIDDSSAEPLRH